MSESLRAIDKSAAQNKNIKEKLRRFENIFDRYKTKLKKIVIPSLIQTQGSFFTRGSI